MKEDNKNGLNLEKVLNANVFEDYAKHCLSYLVTQINSVILDFVLSKDKNRIDNSLSLLISLLKTYLLLRSLSVVINIVNNELVSLMKSMDGASNIKEQVVVIINGLKVMKEHMMVLNNDVESELNKIIE